MSIVKLEDVSFAYRHDQMVIEAINLQFETGTATAIVGQNGAGKSTTVKLMNHLLTPTKGKVLIEGQDVQGESTAQVARRVGYAFQNPDDQIFNNTVRKEIAFGPKMSGLGKAELETRVQQAAQMTGLENELDEHPYNFPYSLRKFISIAAIIAMDPAVYIFDEPTAGQDFVSRQKLVGIIDELVNQGKCVIVITHDMEFVAAHFKRVVVLSEQHVLEDGTPTEVFGNTELMQRANIEAPEALKIAQQLNLTEKPLTVTELVKQL